MGKRIGYVDAMRGLAMLLVVIGHVFYFSFCDKTNIIFRILSEELQIPLFFMVSGFLMSVPGRGGLVVCREEGVFALCAGGDFYGGLRLEGWRRLCGGVGR